jgi:benzoylformate decarboxylase
MSGSVRESVFGLLRELDLTTIFGNPGSTELPMYRDFPADFRYVLALQESVAVAMADGFAQARRGAALVNLHSAIGVGHAMGSLFTAWRNQAPLVVTAGQQARSLLPLEPFLYSERAAELPRPYVKWSCEPARAEDVPAAIARAFHVALQSPCGPTFVSIPVDDWERPAAARPARHEVSRTVGGDPRLLTRAGALLSGARRPVLIVGPGVARAGAWNEVVALAERHQAAVWVSPMSSRNSFPETHALFAGFLPAERQQLLARLSGCDLILVLGAPVFTYHVEGAGPLIPTESTLVQLTEDPAEAARAPLGLSIVTDLKLGIGALLAAAAPARAAPALPARTVPVDATQLTDRYLMQRLAALRPSGSIIVEEAPSSRAAMHDHLPILEPDTFYTCASGGLGYSLPAAVGVSLARPDRRVIALIGDGSAMYSIQGLWSATELDASVTFVIVNNGSYRALEQFAPHFGLRDPPGTRLAHLDFCALARAQGMQAVRIARAADLDGALTAAFATAGSSLLEVCVAG